MEIQEFKEKIEKADDKVKLLSDRKNYQGLITSLKELSDIYSLYLDDNQKKELFDSDFIYHQKKALKRLLLDSIKDENIIKEVLSDEDKIKDFDEYDLSNSLKRLSDNDKIEFIKNEDFINKFECYESDLEKTNGIKPWDKEFIDEEINLAASSGKAVADKGNVR